MVASIGQRILGRTTLDASGQSLIAHGAKVPTGSKTIQIGLRPEKLRFLPNTESGSENVLTCIVAEQIYYGLGLRTVFRLDGRAEVLVDAMLPSGMARSTSPAIGDNVRLGIDAEAISIFEKEG